MSSESTPLIEVRALAKSFQLKRSIAHRVLGRGPRSLRALHDLTLTLKRGETLGIVGESGCGKSTLARCLVRLYRPDAGSVLFEGEDVARLTGARLRQYHRRVQMVFQDPSSSLNPRMTVHQALAEALAVHAMRAPETISGRVIELLELVGMQPDAAERFPHEFSGGQRQRIGIARALSVEPECLIADELVSSLDVSVQAQIVNLLLDLQHRLGLTIIFIAHDLRLVRHISHRVAVMYLGSIVEIGETERLFAQPEHPYTMALLAAAPELDPSRRSLVEAVQGELPSPLDLPPGCPFHPRCPRAVERCRIEPPSLRRLRSGQDAACHLPLGGAG
ncbi:MAG: ABC transporter ATP-binding protein [Proteobacteria bacterium]|nr:ABC transporter ATP-binding protein [Pseudomonadota bacterium]